MPFLTSILTLAAMLYVIARIDPTLAIVAVSASPLLFWVTRASVGRLKGSWKQVKQLESSAMSVLQEVLVVDSRRQGFHPRGSRAAAVHRAIAARLRELMRVMLLQMKFDVTIAMLIAVTSAVTLSLGILHVRAGTLSLGSLLLVIGYLGQLYGPLKTMSKKTSQLQSAIASAERAHGRARGTPGRRRAAGGTAAGKSGRCDRISGRQLRVYVGYSGAARSELRRACGGERRHRGPDWRRQDHATVAADAFL